MCSDDRDFDGLVARHLRLLKAVGRPVPASARVLDFGCGAGGFVDALLRAGLDAYGCDFSQQLGAGNGRLAAIEEPYRLPYPDGWFDVVVSEQVLEHVQDYEQAFREIRRVLEPSGVSLHEFPGRWVSREPHTFVPLATVIQGRWWLWPWARFGLRNQFQQGKTARETVEHNYQFLHEHTTYYGRRDLARHARRVFPGARLLDVEQLAVGGKRSRQLHRLARRVPLLAVARSETSNRALLLLA